MYLPVISHSNINRSHTNPNRKDDIKTRQHEINFRKKEKEKKQNRNRHPLREVRFISPQTRKTSSRGKGKRFSSLDFLAENPKRNSVQTVEWPSTYSGWKSCLCEVYQSRIQRSSVEFLSLVRVQCHVLCNHKQSRYCSRGADVRKRKHLFLSDVVLWQSLKQWFACSCQSFFW